MHGAGGAVGTALLQLGKLLDLEMFGTASRSKLDLVRELGATPIDYKSEDLAEVIHRLAGNGVDAAFDAIGRDNFKRSFSSLRRGGKQVAYGFYNSSMGKGGSVPVDFMKIQLWNLWPNGRLPVRPIGGLRHKQPGWFSEDLTVLFDLLAQGKIKPVIASATATG